MSLSRRAFCFAGAALASWGESGKEALPGAPFHSGKDWVPLLNGRDTSGWRLDTGSGKTASGKKEWFTCATVTWSADSPDELRPESSQGSVLMNGVSTRTMNLATEKKFGDFELYLEFMLAKHSNSGAYHHGLYEVQLFDSYNSEKTMAFSDAGGLYQRWENNKGFGGTPPRANASRPPGQWQSLHTRFRGPRFDANGAKKSEARFETVTLNGILVQENAVLGGPTRSAMEIGEAAENPLMLQGDHGPVAFRNIWIRKLL